VNELEVLAADLQFSWMHASKCVDSRYLNLALMILQYLLQVFAVLLQGSKDRVLEGALLEDGVGSCVS
jgi:hypothetical protein